MVPPKKKIHDGESSRKDKSDPNIKIDVDWRKLFETKIEEQIEDVCWAVSFAATIEARYNKSMDEVKNRLSLSSQCMINNLIKKDDKRTMPPFSKVHKFLGDKGLCTTDICPFEGKLPRNIKKLPKGDRVFTYEPEVIETIKEDDIMRIVAKHGPVMGILDTCRAFQEIGKEIYRGPTNGPLQPHSVCIIGYGTMEGTDFWMNRNSWGVNWGENGYGKIIQKSRSGGRSLFQTIWYPKIVELGESSND